eukprot:scaffold5393_cov35-Prasinocladus_malaysianus.AAC.1
MTANKRESLASVLGGVLASTAAVPVTFPLLAIQVAQQVGGKSNSAIASNLADSTVVWNGLVWALGSALAGHSAYFASFEMVFKATSGTCGRLDMQNSRTSLTSGWASSALLTRTLLSSAVATAVNTPFEILKTRSIAQSGPKTLLVAGQHWTDASNNFMSAITEWNSLVRGFVGNMGGLIGTAIQFSIYHSLLPRMAGNAKAGSAKHAALSATTGVIASGVATTLTFPIDTLKSMVMAADAGGMTFHQAANSILTDRGLSGFYDGLAPALWRNAATAFVTFLLYPVCTTMILGVLTETEASKPNRK